MARAPSPACEAGSLPRFSRPGFSMNTLLYDLRYGIRMLLKNPGFTFAALITLALGVASSTAIFSVIDGVLLHPLPYPESEKIMVMLPTMRSTGAPGGAF